MTGCVRSATSVAGRTPLPGRTQRTKLDHRAAQAYLSVRTARWATWGRWRTLVDDPGGRTRLAPSAWLHLRLYVWASLDPFHALSGLWLIVLPCSAGPGVGQSCCQVTVKWSIWRMGTLAVMSGGVRAARAARRVNRVLSATSPWSLARGAPRQKWAPAAKLR